MNEQEKARKFSEQVDQLLENPPLPENPADEILPGDQQADLEIARRLLQADFSAASRGKDNLLRRLLAAHQTRKPAPARSGLRLLGGLAAVFLLLAGFSWFIRSMVADLPDGGPAGAPITTIPQVTAELRPLIPALSTPRASSSPVGSELAYTVQVGDTCNSIAFTFSIPVSHLVESNDLPPDCSGLFVGQVLRIPPAETSQAPTPAPGAPLSMEATSDQILQHLRQSRSRWSSLWVAALITTGQKNETHVDREQVWLAPGTSRWLSGMEGSPPSLALVCADGSCTLASLPAGERQSFSTSTGIPSQLDHLVYPENFTYQGGEFAPMRIEELLGRQTLVVEWVSPTGRREDRLWVDTVTGLVLRWQHLLPEYADASGRVTPSEIQLTSLAINPPVPASIRWTYDLDTLNFEPGPAPAGFDAASLPLQARVTMLGNQASGQAHFAYDLYAEGYYLRTLDTGAISGGWCDRSPDGRWLAWNYGLGEDPLTLQMVRLEDVREVIEPIPLEELGTGLLSPVAFSPGSDRLAFFACLQTGCGVYMYALESGERRFAALPGKGSPPPVWKPDGSQLAVLASGESGTQELVILEASRLDVVYRGTFDTQTWQPAAGAPILNWGVTIPRSSDGFNRCGVITP